MSLPPLLTCLFILTLYHQMYLAAGVVAIKIPSVMTLVNSDIEKCLPPNTLVQNSNTYLASAASTIMKLSNFVKWKGWKDDTGQSMALQICKAVDTVSMKLFPIVPKKSKNELHHNHHQLHPNARSESISVGVGADFNLLRHDSPLAASASSRAVQQNAPVVGGASQRKHAYAWNEPLSPDDS